MILDSLDDREAELRLRACCGAHRWVDQMMRARPFGSPARARSEADRIWRGLGETDWLEAFDHHPRIGEAKAVAANERSASLSANEQSGIASADAHLRKELARANAEYERRFGFIYIVCAAGKSAEELLDMARSRLGNDREEELAVAAEEQRRIMQLRLARLLETT